MAHVQERRATAGELIGGTFAELAKVGRELAIYFAGFAAAALLAGVNLPFGWIVGVVAFFAYFGAQYWLYRTMLERAGMLHHQRWKLPGFFLMAIVLGPAMYFAASLFVVPGIILGAKWVMAPTYYVAREINPFDAIGESWGASNHNTFQMCLAFTALCLLWLAVFFLLTALSAMLEVTVGISLSMWIGMHLLPVLLMGLSMAGYRRLSDETSGLAEIFG